MTNSKNRTGSLPREWAGIVLAGVRHAEESQQAGEGQQIERESLLGEVLDWHFSLAALL